MWLWWVMTPSRDLTDVTLVSDDNFPSHLKTLQATWKHSRPPGNFPGHLETFQTTWKLSRPPGNFPNHFFALLSQIAVKQIYTLFTSSFCFRNSATYLESFCLLHHWWYVTWPIKVFPGTNMIYGIYTTLQIKGGSRAWLVYFEPEGHQLWLYPWRPLRCKQISQTTILTGIDLTWPTQSGDGHFPGPWRVNVPFANMPQFAEDFKCKKESNLNPEKRCTIW